jgi:hypothetical protein
MGFFVDFALFFRTIDGLLRYGTLENTDKNGLLPVTIKPISGLNFTYSQKPNDMFFLFTLSQFTK